jgi:plastocyanin
VVVGGTGGSSFRFTPSDLTIAVGDTVTFHNTGGHHNTSADDGSFRCAEGCDGDGDGGSGEPSDTAWTATVAFNEPGVVTYHCDPHSSIMRGKITVESAGDDDPSNVPITGGFTGQWYDPAQSGHGLLLEVVPDAASGGNLLVAFWFTFAPLDQVDAPQQSWFLGTGPINGDVATVDTYIESGASWIPNFDHDDVVVDHWGSMTFTFTDCSHGRVDFDSERPGYGSGHMDLVRLTTPVGVTCP